MAKKQSFPEAFKEGLHKPYLFFSLDEIVEIPGNNIEIKTMAFSRTELEVIVPICKKHHKLCSISSHGNIIRFWTYDEPGLSSCRRKIT
jgi:hypothetical protein